MKPEKKPFILCSIDPGLEGALAIFKGGSLQLVEKMPVIKVKKSGKTLKGNPKTKTLLDEQAIRSFLMEHSPSLLVIEAAQTMPPSKNGRTQGVASSGTTMENYGLLRGICVGLGIPYIPVNPRTWKTVMLKGAGISASDKAASVIRAGQIAALPIGQDHNKADAILIGYYGMKEYGDLFVREKSGKTRKAAA